MLFDGIKLVEGSEIQNLVVDSGTAFPANPDPGELFYRTDVLNEGLYTYNGTQWRRHVKVGDAVETLLPDIIAAGTFKSVAVDSKGRVTEGTNPSTLSGYGITDATPSSHVGSTGNQHGAATTSVNGFMSSADKTKLDGIAAGAQVNDVTSVSGKTGAVTLTSSDVGLANVTDHAQVKKLNSSTDGNVPIWNGTTGDQLSNGYGVETTLAGSSSNLARADAVKNYVDGLLAANDAMIFKGTLGTGGTYTALPTTHGVGWTIKVITAATYAGKVAEIGDMYVSLVSRSGSGNLNSDWAVIQTNIDGAVVGPSSSTDSHVAVFDGATGKIIKSAGTVLGNGTLTLATSGIATGSQTFGANQSGNATFTVNVPATNLGYTTAASNGTVTSSTGTNATLPAATTSLAGLMTGADKTKLDGIATGATANTGTVTSVSGTGTVSGLTLSGTVTTSGSLTLGGTLSVTPSNFSSQTANTFLAAPNGTAGVPTFRTIVAADIPTLNQNTTGSAATLTTGRTIGMTGDVTWTSASFNGSANVTGTSTLANSGVTAGTYTAASVTVDAKGRVTSASSNTIPTVNNATLTLNTSGIATGSQTWTANQGSAATFTVNVPGTNIAEGTRTTTTVPITSSTGNNATLSAATTTLAGVMTSADKTKLDGIQEGAQVNVATNLTYSTAATTGTVNSSTGTDATIPAATQSLAGLMTNADKTKLDGIAAGAQVNTVTSVAGKTGAVTLVKGDVGLGNVDDTADSTKSVLEATRLTTARTIGGVSFNGTADINLPGVNTAGNQNTTGSAASLTTPRAINGVNFDGTAAITVPGNFANRTTNESGHAVFIGTTATGNQVMYTNANYRFNPSTAEVSATNFNSTSDANKKTNIKTIDSAVNIVNQLRGVTFDWLDTGRGGVGVIAQEVEQHLPQVVVTADDGTKTVQYGNMVGLLIEAIKEQQKQIEELKSIINNK